VVRLGCIAVGHDTKMRKHHKVMLVNEFIAPCIDLNNLRPCLSKIHFTRNSTLIRSKICEAFNVLSSIFEIKCFKLNTRG
jgi:hypothetical protein